MLYQDNLLGKIENKRNEMILTATKTGITSTQTLTKSRELDDLINLHYKKSVESFSYSTAMTN
ncbi:aspartyl-phosphate phosphatase Spo0E family protein [Neobacillus notoginsengisoli]|nr:aspartyl-phosphate phosphatase Spo0E family protein [Neobacillus notoginsengisoli]